MIPAFGFIALFRRSSSHPSWRGLLSEQGFLALGIALAMHPAPKCIGSAYWFFCIPPFFINLVAVLTAALLGTIAIRLLELVSSAQR